MENQKKLKHLERYTAMLIDKIDNYTGGSVPKYTLEIELERCQEEIKTLGKSG